MPQPNTYIERQRLAEVALSTAEWDCVSAQVRERAFFMAGVGQARALQIFREAAAAVAAGEMSGSEARREIRRGLAAMGYDPGADADSIHDLSSRWRIDLVLDTNERQAQGWQRHAAMLARPLPNGVPNLQAKAWAAWLAEPDSLRPGGKNEQMLPALLALAGRLRPCPEELREWISGIDHLGNSSEAPAGEVVANSAPPGHVCHAIVRPCPYKNKGTTREYRSKNKKKESRAPIKETQSTGDEDFLVVGKENMSYPQSKNRLKGLVKKCTRNIKTKVVGIPGKGYVAPGMSKEFFVTGGSVNEMYNPKHIAGSADAESHIYAAAHVTDLWEKSKELTPPYEDKKPPKSNPTAIKKMYKRKAFMSIRGKRYWVEITAKEFKSDMDSPIIYHVRTHRL